MLRDHLGQELGWPHSCGSLVDCVEDSIFRDTHTIPCLFKIPIKSGLLIYAIHLIVFTQAFGNFSNIKMLFRDMVVFKDNERAPYP